jgi:hypothetical protein
MRQCLVQTAAGQRRTAKGVTHADPDPGTSPPPTPLAGSGHGGGRSRLACVDLLAGQDPGGDRGLEQTPRPDEGQESKRQLSQERGQQADHEAARRQRRADVKPRVAKQHGANERQQQDQDLPFTP